MRPDSRRKPAVAGPVRLADAISPPKNPRPEAKRGPTLPAGIEATAGIDGWAAVLSCSRRLVERMRAAGRIPRPDLMVGKMPRWRASTVRDYLERGGRS